MLVDTTKLVSTSFDVVDGIPLATFGAGITMDAATGFLAEQDNNVPRFGTGLCVPARAGAGETHPRRGARDRRARHARPVVRARPNRI